jgi:hypothetical protein
MTKRSAFLDAMRLETQDMLKAERRRMMRDELIACGMITLGEWVRLEAEGLRLRTELRSHPYANDRPPW